ncbi:protein-tyrosine phosphatase, partial [Thozetella sp. PMI_491]
LDTAAPSAGHPENFGVVVPGVYRSSYPQAQDYTFIRDLKLRTIVTLVDKDFPDSYRSFIAENGIRHHVFSMKGTKKEDIPMKTMRDILRLVLNHQNHPLLIHCNHGKHRTGCVVAVVRKVTGWKLPRIVDEYREFAGAKARDCDVKYITLFDLSSLSNLFAERSAMQVRTRIFIRITVFTFFVLVIWLFSG